MMNKKYIFFVILVLVLSGCSEYLAVLDNNEKTFLEAFFPKSKSRVISSKSLEVILAYLEKNDNLEKKVIGFIEKYGYPLWDYAVSASTENGEKTYVPIYKEGQKVISCIWVFETEKDTVKEYVRIMYPKDYRPKYTWMFDYFTILILKEKPLSRLRFESLTRQNSECVHGSVVVEYNGEEITIDTGIYCWGDDENPGQTDNSGFGNSDDDSDYPHSGGGTSSNNSNFDSSNPPAVINNYSKLTTFFNDTNLSEADALEFNNYIDSLMVICEYSTLTADFFHAKYDSIRYREFDNGASASFDGRNLNINKNSDIYRNAETVAHEWYHMFQYYHNNRILKRDAGMAEFELALFEDIYTLIHFKNFQNQPGDIFQHVSWSGNINNSLKVKEYKDWLSDITSSYTEYPTEINDSVFLKWAQVFGNCPPYRNAAENGVSYRFNDPGYGTESIQRAFNLVRDCLK